MEDNKSFIFKQKLLDKLQNNSSRKQGHFSEKSNVADTFNEVFSNVVKKLKIEKDENLLTDVIEETDPVLKAITKYNNHPSILWIKSSFKDPKVFSFKYFNVMAVINEINNVKSKKATPKGDIPVKTLKSSSNIIAPAWTECFNQSIKSSTFTNELKNADVSKVYKKKDRHDKSN